MRTILLICTVATWCAVSRADPPPSPAPGATPAEVPASERTQNRRVLSDFGPYGTQTEATAAFEKALRAMIAQGGGVLIIPRDAPEGWYPRNRMQAAYGTPAVTVVDVRGGIERVVYVPPLGATASDGLRGGSRLIERDASGNFPWQGVYSTEAVVSRFRGGASS